MIYKNYWYQSFIDYPNSDALKIKEQKETLAEVGIHLEDFGQNSFIVRAHPTWYPAAKRKALFAR